MKRKNKLTSLVKIINNYFTQWHKLNIKTKDKMKKVFICLSIIISAVVCVSCNATRTITTTQTHIKGQDTITTMTTRTTESYDASIKPKNVY